MRQMMIPGDDGGLRQQAPRSTTQQRSGLGLSLDQGAAMKQQDDRKQQMQLKRALKKKRSSDYMSTVQLIDSGGQTLNQASFDQLINELIADLGPLDPSLAGLIGIIDKCYLGDPYEVHMLDMNQNIIEHYEKGRPLPGALEKYRGMAASGSYAFIEVYASYACAVRPNGQVTLIES